MYTQRVILAGKTIEIRKSTAPQRGRGGKGRAAKLNPTPELQKRVNERKAVDTLTWRLNTNFGEGDTHMVLTYRREYTPTPAEARAHLEKFMRRARAYFRQQGRELKYVTVTEYKRARVHHHLVLPEIPAAVLHDLWPFGRPHCTPLDESGDYRQLAEYLIKETSATFAEAEGPYKKRWNQSKNLVEPKITTETIKASTWRSDPKPRAGYYIKKDSIREGVHEVTGHLYQYYTMVMLPPKRKREKT